MQSEGDLNVEFALPSPLLRDFVSAYHIFDAGPIKNSKRFEVFFPGWANLRFRDLRSRLSIEFKNAKYEQTPLCCLFGPSSNLARSENNGGRLIGAGITPLGFTRMFSFSAHTIANSIIDVEPIFGSKIRSAHQNVHNADDVHGVKNVLDEFFKELIGLPHQHDPIAENLHKYISEEHDLDVEKLALRLEIEPHTLRRVSKRYFGFSPKLLLRRSRFLKSIINVIKNQNTPSIELIDSDYFDYSHFVKDCYEFFGMSPGEFVSLDAPLTKLSFRKRAEVLGAHMQSLHKKIE